MNRDVVFATLPGKSTWASLDGIGRRRAVENAISVLLSEFDRCGAEPDAWEATDIETAMAALLRGWNTLAWNCVARALEPPTNRARAWPREPGTPSVDQLRRRLADVRGAADSLGQ